MLDHDGLDYGGEVIVPNLSFIASATAALDRRLGVVLVDVEPDTLLIDPKRVEEAIVPGKTRAIMAVHLFGQPANMTALRQIATRHKLKIFEDAAQAHGSEWETGPGSLGDAAAFSFQSFKNLSCGEGGALTTNDETIFERAYAMHNVGRALVGGGRWDHHTLGFNCRPTEYQAALLMERFRAFDHQQETRRRNFAKLRELLEDLPCVAPLGVNPGVRRHGVHTFVMRYRPEYCEGLLLPDFLKLVQAEGVPLGRAYTATMAQQPVFQKLLAKHSDYLRVMSTPVAEQATKEIIYLPQDVFLGKEADMVEIAAAIRKVQIHYAPKAVKTKSASQPLESGVTSSQPSAVEVEEHLPSLRCGIVGVGVMGRNHAASIAKNSLVSLAAVTDSNQQGHEVAAEFNCLRFDSPEKMISSGKIDTVIIATPHWQHTELSIAALRAGLHVICEKPLAVTVGQADELLAVAKQSKGKFFVVHQSRFEPAYQEARRILDGGELGRLIRCSMIETMWRSDAYYKSSPWRGTWKGEGGGVLLNQAPHVLDRYAWLCGMPEHLSGRCDTLLHRIEVEDAASAICRHANGSHGYIHVSTNECPEVSQTVIACDRGRIVIEKGVLRVTRLRRSISEATRTDPRFWGADEGETQEFAASVVSSITELLDLFYRNVALSVANKAKLVCPGEEGRNAVELANAIILSSALGREVTLPIDRAAYAEFIAGKVRAETMAN